ncbi:MAG: hypothetical protein OSA97_16920, partial [Nevskia sp.]|nr:hypothetical protein [Nevskia sp.]
KMFPDLRKSPSTKIATLIDRFRRASPAFVSALRSTVAIVAWASASSSCALRAGHGGAASGDKHWAEF